MTITPAQITAWIAIGTLLIGGLGTLAGMGVKEYFTIRGQIIALKTATDKNTASAVANTATAAAHDSTINTLMAATQAIALATPAAAQAVASIAPAISRTPAAPLAAAHAGVMPPADPAPITHWPKV
jgi:hypothetical protein